jgi:hypothetical protein
MNKKLNAIKIGMDKQIADTNNKIPSKDDMFTGKGYYRQVQNPHLVATNNVIWRYTSCPKGKYVCGIGLGYQDKWEARFGKVECCN